MDKIKCITFDKNAQDSLPQHIKDKMKADRENARKNEMEVHKKQINKEVTGYYFTKSKDNCLCVEYNPKWDFGKQSASGARLDSIDIHYNNSFTRKDLIKITIEEVPQAIIDVLSFLSK